MSLCSAVGLLSSMAILYVENISIPMLYGLLFLFGFACCGQSISFALVKENNLATRVGTAIGFNNMAVVTGGALFQPLVGLLLYLSWQGGAIGGAAVYDYGLAIVTDTKFTQQFQRPATPIEIGNEAQLTTVEVVGGAERVEEIEDRAGYQLAL